MSQNKLQWFAGGCAIVALFLIGLILHPSIVHEEVFYITGTYIVVDAFVFIIGYMILQKLNTLVFWKFLTYLLVIVAASLIFNFLLSGVLSKSTILFLFIIFVFFVFANLIFWKTIFGANIRIAFLVGVLLSIVNTLLCFMGTTVAI